MVVQTFYSLDDFSLDTFIPRQDYPILRDYWNMMWDGNLLSGKKEKLGIPNLQTTWERLFASMYSNKVCNPLVAEIFVCNLVRLQDECARIIIKKGNYSPVIPFSKLTMSTGQYISTNIHLILYNEATYLLLHGYRENGNGYASLLEIIERLYVQALHISSNSDDDDKYYVSSCMIHVALLLSFIFLIPITPLHHVSPQLDFITLTKQNQIIEILKKIEWYMSKEISLQRYTVPSECANIENSQEEEEKC